MDLGLLPLPVDDGSFFARVLFRERLAVLVPTGHRLTALPTVRLADLRPERFVMCPRDERRGYPDLIASLSRVAGSEPGVAVEASSVAAHRLVQAGAGIAVVPQSVAADPGPGLCALPLTDPEAVVAFAAIWKEMTPGVRVAVDGCATLAARDHGKTGEVFPPPRRRQDGLTPVT